MSNSTATATAVDVAMPSVTLFFHAEACLVSLYFLVLFLLRVQFGFSFGYSLVCTRINTDPC